MSRILFLKGGVQLGPNDRWITVHAPGHEKGQPVLIQQQPDGSARVIGGAGGALNYLKLRKVKSEAEYKQEAAQDREKRRQATKEQRAKDKAAGLLTAKKQAHEAVQSQREEHERQFIDTVAQAMGWDKSVTQFHPPDDPEMPAAEVDKLRRQHHRKVLRKAEQAVDFQRKALVASAAARMEAGIGEVPLEGAGPDVISVQDLDPNPADTAQLAPAMDVKKMAEDNGMTPEKAKEEAQALKGKPSKAGLIVALAHGEGPQAIEDNLKAISDDEPVQDLKASIAPAKKAVELLKAQKQLRQIQKQAREAAGEIQRATSEPKAYVLEAKDEPNIEKKVADSILDDLRTIQSRAFLSELTEMAGNDPERALGVHIAAGAFNSINSLALTAGGDALVDRGVVDVLGVAGAAQVLARRLQTDLGDEDVERVAEALKRFHTGTQVERGQEAISQARDLMNEAEAIEIGEAATGSELQAAQELNAKRRNLVTSAQKTLGRALGEMEANAAMLVALRQGKRDRFEVSLGKTRPEQAIMQAHALGLQTGDYKIDNVAGDTFLTVEGSGLDRLARPVSKESLEQVKRNLSIIRGDEDEAGWLPLGVARRPDLATTLQPGIVPELPQSQEALDQQNFQIDDAAADALHRALAAAPEGVAAFKTMGDLSHAELKALRESTGDWKGAVHAAGSPLKAYREAQVSLQAKIGRAFATHYNKVGSGPKLAANESGIGKAATEQIAKMMSVVGRNFRPGQPIRLWEPAMSGGKNAPRQRLIKLLDANKRVMAAFGTGSGKSLLQLAGFTHLKEQGKVSRGMFLVPSIVQGQFSGEALRYLQPGKFNWHIQPGASREERIAAYKDPKHDFCVMTHASFRDDMVHLGAKQAGVDEAEMSKRLGAMTPEQRQDWIKGVMDAEGINFDYLTVDESQNALNRAGKENSTLANVVDALSAHTPYYLSASGDPVKNDASEIFDLLRKMDPGRYTDRDAFMRRYGGDTLGSKDALRREMARYVFPSRIDPDITVHRQESKMDLSEGQKQALADLDHHMASARIAQMTGNVDVDAVRALSPSTFEGVPDDKVEELAARLQKNVGMLKTAAMNRIIYEHPDNPIVEDVVAKAAERKGKPGVVFAHSRAAVQALSERLAKEGHRVVTITGSDSAIEKERKRLMFRPEQGEAKADILVASDAAATGMNIQRGQWLYQFDTPQTAMTHAQRNGRINRIGQKNDVELIDAVPDHPEVRRARERLQRKYGLRELMTSPMEGLDDTGLAYYLRQVQSEQQQQKLAA